MSGTGAPTITGMAISASWSSSSAVSTVGGPYSSSTRSAASVPRYGSPPPPVPRMAAPRATSLTCSASSVLISLAPVDPELLQHARLEQVAVHGSQRRRDDRRGAVAVVLRHVRLGQHG